jgi:hypothetical protein
MSASKRDNRYDIIVVSLCKKSLPKPKTGVEPGTYVKIETSSTRLVRGDSLHRQRPVPEYGWRTMGADNRIPDPSRSPASATPTKYNVRRVYDSNWVESECLEGNARGYIDLGRAAATLKKDDRLMVVPKSAV